MRRAEKEVKDLEQLEEILRDCNTVRIGTQDAEGMFIVPVNYGYDLTEGQLTLYLPVSYTHLTLPTTERV